MRTCPDCHSLVEDNAIFCDNCGFRMSPVEREIQPTLLANYPPPPSKPAVQPPALDEQTGACSSCGYINVAGEMFCQNCGVQLAPVVSIPPPPPTPVPQPASPPVVPTPPSAPMPVPPPSTPPTKPPVIEAVPPKIQPLSPGVCSNCGYQNALDETFCQNCGQLLEARVPGEPELENPVPFEGLPDVDSLPEEGVELPPESPEPVLDIQKEPIFEPALEISVEEPIAPAIQEEQPEAAELASEVQIPVEIPAPMPSPGTSPIERARLEEAAAEIKGKLVMRSNGVEIALPVGHTELTIGRADLVRNIFPDIDVSAYGGENSGVSRMHARLVLKDQQLFIEDLNSTNYTFVNRLRLQPGQPYIVNDGDEIRLGLLAMNYFVT